VSCELIRAYAADPPAPAARQQRSRRAAGPPDLPAEWRVSGGRRALPDLPALATVQQSVPL